jgi:hypothetical protein
MVFTVTPEELTTAPQFEVLPSTTLEPLLVPPGITAALLPGTCTASTFAAILVVSPMEKSRGMTCTEKQFHATVTLKPRAANATGYFKYKPTRLPSLEEPRPRIHHWC